MTVELHGALCKSIKIRGLELASPVRADHVTIQTVKQHNDDVLRALAFHHDATLGQPQTEPSLRISTDF